MFKPFKNIFKNIYCLIDFKTLFSMKRKSEKENFVIMKRGNKQINTDRVT